MSKKVNSTADVLDDWLSLLRAVAEDAAVLPNVEPHRLALEQVYNETLAAKTRRDLHAASKQQATQEMRTLKLRGRDAAIALRGAVKADMGPRNERLVHYSVAPLRRRQPKKPVEETPTPEPQGPALPPQGPEPPAPTAPGGPAVVTQIGQRSAGAGA